MGHGLGSPGGDTDILPVRYGHSNFYVPGGEDIPTDLYYSDLDGTWNANGNSIYGEAVNYSTGDAGDGVDLFPDLWVGRLPSNNVAEAQVLIDKTLAYLQNPPIGYQNRYLFLGEVLFPQNWTPGTNVQYDGAQLCEDSIDSLQAWDQSVRLYENYTAWPGSFPETKTAVVDSINHGWNVVIHSGHGYVNTMSIGLGSATLVNSDADGFTNGDRTFLLYAVNCTSSALDFNCIAERFMLNANGGAVASVGSTRLDFPQTASTYQTEFFGMVFRRDENEIGRAMAEAKAKFISFAGLTDNTNRWIQFDQIYLGDPDLELWTDVPASLAVTHASTFTLGQGTYSVHVESSALPQEGARVALYKNGDAYAVGYTDVSGNVLLPFRPDETGAFTVGVYLHNSLPYVGNATVVAPGSSPYLYALSQGITDDGSGSSVGDGDGSIDAGETDELNVTLKNNGSVTESGVSATLSTSDPNVTVVDNFSSYPDIAPGASAAAGDPFVISVAKDAPDRALVHCTLTVFGVLGSYSQDLILYVHAPDLRYYQQAIRDTVGNGNGNGVIAANEDFAILPTVLNVGLGAAHSAQARLRSTDPAVTITDSVAVLGDIPGKGKAYNPADAVRLRLSDVSTAHTLTLAVVDAYGEEAWFKLDITPPDSTSNLITYGNANSISLDWTRSPSADLQGYAVYRSSSSSGPFTRLNTWLPERTAYYNDESLPGLTRYYYRVAPVDSSGNLGKLSAVASATTSLPLHLGFPVEVKTATTAGATVADLDHNGQFEVIGASDEIYAVTADGDDYFDGDDDVRTLGPITKSGSQQFWDTPAVGDVDGDGLDDIAAVSWNDSKLRIVDHHGNQLAGWPKSVNVLNQAGTYPLGSVCLADLDADGRLDVVAQASRVIYAWHHDGTELIDGDANASTNGVLAITGSDYSYGSPTVANIDADPYKEIIAGMRDGKLYVYHHDGTPYPGFPFVTGNDITSAPAVGDIDGDGRPEIVFGSSDAHVYAIRSDGSSATGFPTSIQLNEDSDSSPALGDMTGDGHPDVVIGASNGDLFIYSGTNGSVPSGWPVHIKDNLGTKVAIRGAPVIADVDGDGNPDIVVGDMIGRLHGFNKNGQELPGFPIQTGNIIQNGPAVWDVDGDGLTEVVVQSFDQKIYMWDTPWTFRAANAPWPMFKHDSRNSGDLTTPILPATTAVPDREPGLTPALLQNFPNPFRAATVISYSVPQGPQYRGVQLRIYDMNGRVVRTLIDGEQPPGRYQMTWDGRDQAGRPVASGIYPYRLQVAGNTQTRKMVVLR